MAKRVPSGPVGLPILGSSLRFSDDPLGFMERCARRYGDVARLGAYGRDVYQVTDPEGIQHVLVSNARNYEKPDFGGEGLDGLLGSGLLTSDGPVWQEGRGLVQPAFYREQLVRYGETMTTEAANACASWADGEEVDVHAEMSMLTLRIVVETVLGAELDGMERYVAETLVDVGAQYRADDARTLIPQDVPTPRNLRYKRGVKRLDRVVRDIVRQRRGDGEARNDVLGLLLRAREDDERAVSDEQVRDEVLTMLLAGNDTTALALTYAWYLLSTHPEAEHRFHGEVDEVVDGVPTVEDLPDLKYTEQILQETMRLFPPAYTIYREAVEDDEVAGFHVPAGALVSLPQWVVHRDARYWAEPEAFRPERWERETDRPAFAYFPFGGGPRKCIGDRFATMEARLVLATIGSRFALDYVGPEPIEFAPMVTLHPAHPMPMVVRERGGA